MKRVHLKPGLVLSAVLAAILLGLPAVGYGQAASLNHHFPRRALNGGPADSPVVEPFSIPGPGLVTMTWRLDTYQSGGYTTNWPIGFRKKGQTGFGPFPGKQIGGQTFADGVEVISPRDGSIAVKTLIYEVSEKMDGLEVGVWPIVPPGSFALQTQLDQKVSVTIEYAPPMGKDTPPPLGAGQAFPLTLAELFAVNWQLAFEDGTVLGRVMFRDDGSLYGFTSRQILRWVLKGNVLELLDEGGKTSLRFPRFGRSNDLWIFAGTGQAGEKRGYVLRQTDPLRIR